MFRMKPITFCCTDTLPFTGPQIAEQILDLNRWTDFKGYGPLPGIQAAEFDCRTTEVVGTRIRVTESGGSQHLEEIVDWSPDRRVQIDMYDFAPPLSYLATRFVEVWEFVPNGTSTEVLRSFALYPKSILTRPLLWLISKLLKQAIVQHLKQLRSDAPRSGVPS